MRHGNLRGRTRVPNTVPELPTDSELRGTRGATGCNLAIYEVAPVRTSVPYTFRRTTPPSSQQFPSPATGRAFRVLSLYFKQQFPSPATGMAFRVLSLYSKRAVSKHCHWKSIPRTEFVLQTSRFPSPATGRAFCVLRLYSATTTSRHRQARNLRGRTRSLPNPKHLSPIYRRIPSFAELVVRPGATSSFPRSHPFAHQRQQQQQQQQRQQPQPQRVRQPKRQEQPQRRQRPRQLQQQQRRRRRPRAQRQQQQQQQQHHHHHQQQQQQ